MSMRIKVAILAGSILAIGVAATSFGAVAAPALSAHALSAASQPSASEVGHSDMMHWKPVHSEAKVVDPQGKFATMIIDRGVVTSVTATTLTIKRDDAQVVTVTPDSSTRIRRNGESASLSDIKAGDHAMVMQLVQDGTTRVLRVHAGTSDFAPGRFHHHFGGNVPQPVGGFAPGAA